MCQATIAKDSPFCLTIVISMSFFQAVPAFNLNRSDILCLSDFTLWFATRLFSQFIYQLIWMGLVQKVGILAICCLNIACLRTAWRNSATLCIGTWSNSCWTSGQRFARSHLIMYESVNGTDRWSAIAAIDCENSSKLSFDFRLRRSILACISRSLRASLKWIWSAPQRSGHLNSPTPLYLQNHSAALPSN